MLAIDNMTYPRQIYPVLEAELEKREITVITGMRSVGKTTALRHLYQLIPSENKAMLDLENPLHRKVFEEENYDVVWHNLASFGITNTQKAYLCIDEVQHLPDISRVAKYLYDHWDVKFILTGSSSFYLRNLFPESMAGRKMLFELYPLTFGEFLVFRQTKREALESFEQRALGKNHIAYETLLPFYDEYMEFGGFPSVVLEPHVDRKRAILSEIFTSYFEKDAKNLSDFRDMSKLRDLVLLLAPRTGSRIEINKLASDLSLSRETVYSYLAFLEHTYFISMTPKHSGSVDRQSAGSRKLYFCDSGIANTLGNISSGHRLEQSVFQSLRPHHDLAYESREKGKEIDFIIDRRIALEVKETMSRRDAETLRTRSAAIGLREYYVACYQFTDNPVAVLVTDI